MARASCALALPIIVLLATAAWAQQASFNCDDARRLGTPKTNQCAGLCTEVGKRNKAYASANLQQFCNTQCASCVAAANNPSTCKSGAKAPLPKPCQTAFQFPVVLQVINDFLKAQIAAEKGQPAAKSG